MRPGIFVSRTREKLGCTCDQIGRTLEPCSAIFNFWQEWKQGCEGLKYNILRGLYSCQLLSWWRIFPKKSFDNYFYMIWDTVQEGLKASKPCFHLFSIKYGVFHDFMYVRIHTVSNFLWGQRFPNADLAKLLHWAVDQQKSAWFEMTTSLHVRLCLPLPLFPHPYMVLPVPHH